MAFEDHLFGLCIIVIHCVSAVSSVFFQVWVLLENVCQSRDLIVMPLKILDILRDAFLNNFPNLLKMPCTGDTFAILVKLVQLLFAGSEV